MKSYVYTSDSGKHFHHTKEGKIFSIELLDDRMKATGIRFSFTHDNFDLAVSTDCSRIAVVDDERRIIEVFQPDGAEPIAALNRPSYGVKLINPIGKQIYIKSSGGYFQWDFNKNRLSKITLQIDDFSKVIEFLSGFHQLIPGRKKGVLVLLDLNTGAHEDITTQIPCTFYYLKYSTVTKKIVGIGKNKTLYIFSEDLSLIGEIPLKKHANGGHIGIGCFSGDGRLFTAAVAGQSGNKMLVVDGDSKTFSHEIATVCYDLPFIDSWVRDASSIDGTYEFRTVDLITGKEAIQDLRSPNNAIHSDGNSAALHYRR